MTQLHPVLPDAVEQARRESRLRAAARRSGLALRKCRRLSPDFWWEIGTFGLVDAYRNVLIFGDRSSGFGMTLDDIEEFLREYDS